jgi:phosphoglucomutase/phosphomannomutase
VPQVKNIIDNNYWDYLLDSFYQVIPFGTGGRRGEVGVGPNRINPWTIQASAQGHSQFLIKKYGSGAKKRGVVLAYDVRKFYTNKYFDDKLKNPVRNLGCRNLAIAAAKVYAANGIKVYLFKDIRTTPELSFAVRYLRAVAGDMFSASHNPPEHNGKKVYDETGGQLIPPFDEELVTEVTIKVKKILVMDFELAKKKNLIQMIGEDVDNAYVKMASLVSLSKERNISIAYTPLHGCGNTSVVKVLTALGFKVSIDPKTGYPSGKFENVTFNIPNPEVKQSFDTPLRFAVKDNADILLNSDPDADRIGIMVKDHINWIFLNGNEIAAILGEYVVQKRNKDFKGKGVIIKTLVTTDLIKTICEKNSIRLIGDLLVGFKYIGDEMNELEKNGKIDNFLFGCEESHGYIAGNYIREKDAVVPAIWLSELAAELKKEKRNLMDYLKAVYAKYGFFRNYLTEIRLPGAEGMSKISDIQSALRKSPPSIIGEFIVNNLEDCLDRKPIVSETDRSSKNVLIFNFKPIKGTSSIKVTVRPSGTEPKIKMYFEIGSLPFQVEDYDNIKQSTEIVLRTLEKSFMKYCYSLIGIDFPDRGFLLFWQLPVSSKLKYFEIESSIASLRDLKNKEERKNKLEIILAFLGSDPIEKVDEAFTAKYGKSLRSYLNLRN